MLLPGVTYEEVRGLHSEIRQLANMGRVGLCTSLHIVCLQIVDIDALIIEHAVETIDCELLIDAVDSGLDILLALVEVLPVDRAQRGLLQISAT